MRKMDKVIRVGILGTGGISHYHVQGYKQLPQVEVLACCDINEERAIAYGDKYDIPHVYKDYRDMLKMRELDAVSICTWNNIHAPAAIAALQAGKHVLCEKPPALSTQLALDMQQAAEQAGKLLMIGFTRRFGTDTRILKGMLDNGYFGTPYYVKASYVRRVGNPRGWFADKERSGGGPLIDLGVHMIDLARYLLGKPKVVSVYGATFNTIGPRNNIKAFNRYSASDVSEACNVEDMVTALIRFEGGAVMHLEASFSQHIKDESVAFQIYGDKAGATLMPEFQVYTEMNDILMDCTPHFSRESNEFEVIFTRETEHFIDCIQQGEPCLNPVEDGVEIMRILDAIYESAATGHEVVIKR